MSPTASTRIHEVDFCAQVASFPNAIFANHQEYPFQTARIEGQGQGTQSRKRKDLRVYDKTDHIILCGEVKLPGTPEGRSPYADELVRDAHQKADDAGVQYFFTWNVNLFVLWDRKKWDVPLLERRVNEWNLSHHVTSPDDVGRPDILGLIQNRFLPELFADLSEICTGRKTDWAMPADDLFIRSMESHLEWPIAIVRSWMLQHANRNKPFDTKLQEWMASQDWTFVRKDPQEWFAAIHRAASSLAYLLMNRIIFYKALFDKFQDLPRLEFRARTKTAAEAYSDLQGLFEKAVLRSGDYEPLFYPHEKDWAGPLLFEPTGAIQAWKGVLRAISGIDFRRVSSDVLGRIFQRLIGPEERHRYGQHFTGDDVVDLINAFCIRTADAKLLDPACGSGSFLVRAYYRKKALKPRKTHLELISEIFGCDISLYPAHLATLNLAAREINEEANYPRIARRNFLRFRPDQEFCRLPAQRGGEEVAITIPELDAVVANPPYVRQEKIEKKEKDFAQRVIAGSWPGLRLSGRSDLHCYFWPTAARLMRKGGYLGFLTSSSWLDVEYGFALQRWALQNFQILSVMESNAEPWFPDARVKTCVTIMRRCADETMRMATQTKFVQFKKTLAEIIGVPVADESRRQQAAQLLRDEIESARSNTASDRMRVIIKGQSELWQAGVRAGQILENAPPLIAVPDLDADDEDEGDSAETQPIVTAAGDYAAGKWGRYLRAPDLYFDIMQEFGNKFAPLGELVTVRFGVKSGCDAFFMPRDITKAALQEHTNPREFRQSYGIDRSGVANGRIKIVKAGDKSVHPIESGFVPPVVHSIRNLRRPVINSDQLNRVVLMVPSAEAYPADPHVRRYLNYGETHTFTSRKSKAVPVPLRSTCAARETENQRWYDLTGLARGSFALWPKATQYGHIAPQNPNSRIANCRLYYLSRKPGTTFNELTFTAILNSTIVSFWRSFYGRYTGTEGSLDTEIVDVNLIDVPRPVIRDPHLEQRIQGAFEIMKTRDIGPLVEEELLKCLDPERAQHIAAGPLVLPKELGQPDRRTLDEAVFEMLGVADPIRRERLVQSLYVEVARHFRWIRVVEIQKMEQRRNSGPRKLSTEELASDLWDAADVSDLTLLKDWLAKQRGVTTAVIIPDANPAYLSNDAEMFDNETVYFGKERKSHMICRSREEAELVKLIADLGVNGAVHIPQEPAGCAELSRKITARVAEAKSRFEDLAETRTSLEDKRKEMVDLLLRWFVLGRPAPSNHSGD